MFTIRQLEISIDAKDAPLKLAETRLENRQNRPMQELCTDLPLEGLIEEVQAIKNSILKLEDKLDDAKYVYYSGRSRNEFTQLSRLAMAIFTHYGFSNFATRI